MNVNDLRNGDPVIVAYVGVEDSRQVVDYERGTFSGWDDHGINVTIRSFEQHIEWKSPNWVADPVSGAAVVRFDEDGLLPTTKAEAE